MFMTANDSSTHNLLNIQVFWNVTWCLLINSAFVFKVKQSKAFGNAAVQTSYLAKHLVFVFFTDGYKKVRGANTVDVGLKIINLL
jgi:hypothetical protein